MTTTMATTQKPTIREVAPELAAMDKKLRELVQAEADALHELDRPSPDLGVISLAEQAELAGKPSTVVKLDQARLPARNTKFKG